MGEKTIRDGDKIKYDQSTIFDYMSPDEKEIYAPKTATDWRWRYSDYPETNGIKVFSCFACGGGSTMGYKLAGCDVIGCVEIDPKMNSIYVANHHPKYNYLMDLRHFNTLDLPRELYELDVLDGSPPCTTFSMAGEREKSWGKLKKFREGQHEQTLDDLSFVFIDTVKKLRPKVVIMENVEGLLLGEAWEYVKRIYKEFASAGYNVRHYLLKGENMGIPQRRHRVFFVAFRNDIGVNIDDIDMSFNYEPVLYECIKEGDGESIPVNTKDYKMLQLAERQDKSIADIYERLGEKPRRFSASICWDDEVLPTILAKIFHYRPHELTRISISDVIHAQTFPEDYDFNGAGPREIEYICGMSVPPVMMKRIITRLIDQNVFAYKTGG